MNGFNLSDITDARLGATTLGSIYLGYTKLWPLATDYSREYLTIESLADNNTISWFLSDGNYGINKTIAWSTDKTNWTSVTSHYSSPGRTITTLNTGDKIYLKGTNTQLSKGSAYCKFNSTGNYNVYGNIMSLLYGDNFIGQTTLPSATYNFYSIFRSSKVVDASNLILPATTLTDYCYAYMFMGCTALTSAPLTLPATTLADRCYESMFDGCTALTSAPLTLPATTLADRCYGDMFYGCTSLTTAPELPATTLANSCYNEMFCDCTSLTTAPELPATTLASYCYQNMFYGCTSLSYIKCLATNISEISGLINWVSKVASTGTFVKPSSMTSWPTGSNGIPSGWTVVNI